MLDKNRATAGWLEGSMVENLPAGPFTQQVDFLRYITRSRQILLTWDRIWQLGVLWLGILLLGTASYALKQVRVATNLRQLTTEVTSLEQQLQGLQNTQFRETMQQGLRETLLRTQKAQNGVGFAKYLEALAASCTSGIWLTEFNFKKVGVSTIVGRVYDPDEILQFVSALNKQEIFIKTPFYLYDIANVKASQDSGASKSSATALYNFTLKTAHA